MADGDTAEVERLYNEQIRQGKTPDSINNAVAAWIKQNNPAIREAAEAIEAGNIELYNGKINEIVESGVSMANAVKWVEAERKKMNEPETAEKEEAPDHPLTWEEIQAGMTSASTEKTYGGGYTTGMLNGLLEDGEIDAALAVREAMLKSGKTEQSIKSSLTSYWKERVIAAYEAGDTQMVNQLMEMLVKMGLNRSTVQGWMTPKKSSSSSKSSGFGSSKGFGSGFGSSSSKKSGFGSSGFGSGSFGSSSTKKKTSSKKNRYW